MKFFYNTLLTLLLFQCINKEKTIYKDEFIEVYFSNKYKISKNKCPLPDCLQLINHEFLPSEAMIIDSGKFNENLNQWLELGVQSLKNKKEIVVNEVVDQSENCQKALIIFKSDYKDINTERIGLQLSSISLIKTKEFSRGIYWRHILTNNIENLPLLQKGLESVIRATLINAKCIE
ncbi:hypothetical protein LEP1GSC195_1438 [Leptospira wolbachii serovar Codice str. CDC]|uniref:Uncharacterized protein n=1 Tax=Leptospira wolbachii serovar Codice str. CDC TaxID=1218599 RepID=R8ZYB9_9LEPT|nr:hypothetical protein [Leptospira wolbachii]EOQ94832.1 hypothetical protein LEP1GSC195_1438 [Leptospira wolbachii serovar Codice str. CDC]